MNLKEKLLVTRSDGDLDEKYIGRIEIRRKDADIFAFIWIKNDGCELRDGLFNEEVYIKEFDKIDFALFEAQDRIEKYLNRKVLFVPDKDTFPLNKWINRKCS